MPLEITVLVPVYGRPQNVLPLIQSFAKSRPQHCNLMFVASPEDKDEREALGVIPHLVAPFRRARGDWAKKINWAYKQTTEPWILCAADDVKFHPGWDTCLRRGIKSTGKRVLGTNDLNPHANKDGIYSPHPLVSRAYADQWGTVDTKNQIFCELYDHNYPDRELAATAIARDEWLYVADAVIEHQHPSVSDTPDDPTYELGRSLGQRDYLLHQRRARMWIKEKRLRERKEHLARNPR